MVDLQGHQGQPAMEEQPPEACEAFCRQFGLHLNPQQQEAVRTVSGPVLVLAVPGSGKTTMLVARLGYMIHCAQVKPEQILTLTYTVAATRDMAARFGAFFGEEMERRLEFRTINGICAKVISYYGNLIGKNAFCLVTDEKFLGGILAQIYRSVEGKFATESDLKDIRTRITYIKNGMLSPEEIDRLEEEADCRIGEIYKAYCGELRRQGLMDYDDQMVYACRILEGSPLPLGHFRERYQYVCVDEAQDTSRIQHRIIALLAGERDNLFLVGDEDQSIYGFRAAYPKALLDFGIQHPGAKVLLMEENYRSNARIVAAADRFIQNNALRHEKHMRAVREAGSEIRLVSLKGRGAQYAYLAKVARDCQVQTAVLYRDNESVLPLVDRLEREGIPYRIRNAELGFFTHRVVLDIRNIIEFALHPDDTELFLQVYYKMSTYINKETALGICEMSRRDGMEVLETAVRYGGLGESVRRGCRAIQAHLAGLRKDPAWEGIDRILQKMGYREYLTRSGMGDGKLFILKAIARQENSLPDFLARLDRLQEILRMGQADPDCKFLLSTIHASKGLEYDMVYLMDVADGIFPESVPDPSRELAGKEREVYEEERRLFYVGVTRAREQLSIFQFGQKSTFARELLRGTSSSVMLSGDCRLEGQPGDRPLYFTKNTSLYGQGFLERGGSREGTGNDSGEVSRQEACEAYETFRESLGEGLAVRHKKWGEGAVAAVWGDKVSIQFGEQTRQFDMRVLFANKLLEIQ